MNCRSFFLPLLLIGIHYYPYRYSTSRYTITHKKVVLVIGTYFLKPLIRTISDFYLVNIQQELPPNE
jgi:hypothetical protein